ncbi:MAG: ABC transporter permease [Candidatus Magasanikbacteria bacterium]|jgi:putative ABC transport system permease protein
MNILENIHSVWRVLGRNKIRSFLTMLGIIIGVMAVIVVMSVGAGAQSLILNQVKSLGSDLIGVLPGASDEKGPPASAMGIVITTLKSEDVEKVVKNGGDFPHITAGTGYVKGSNTITWDGNEVDSSFTGVNASLIEVEDAKVGQGRFFTDEEDKTMARVVVLGYQVASDLFGDDDPIGKNIKIKKTTFNIIGVMEKRGSSGFQNQDTQVFVPMKTAQKLLLGIDYISFARLKVDKPENVDEAMDYTRQVLRERHDIDNPTDDDFNVRSMAQGVEAITQITDALKFFLVAVAAIALIVGGIGIMNIMLAAVQERTREIGLRKAVGAKNRHIVEQFLVETVMITFVGGAIGIALGILISFIVAKVAQGMGYDWDFVISFGAILLGCGVSIGVGLLFGISPARQAAALDPIEALRYE